MLLKTVFTVILALSIKLIIDGVVGQPEMSVGLIVALLVSGFLISAAASVFNGYLVARAGADILADVRTSLFDRLQVLSMSFHRRSQAGDLLARFSSDIAQLSGGVIKQPIIGLTSVVALVFYVPVMVTLEPRLALPAILAMPLVVYLVNRYAPDPDRALDDEKQKIAGVLSEVSENLRAQPIIRAFSLHSWSEARFRSRIEELHEASSLAEFRIQLVATLSEYSVALVQVMIVGMGAVLALGGTLEAGTLAAFVALLVEFTWETQVIGRDVLPEIRKAWSGVRRIDLLLATMPAVTGGEVRHAVPALQTAIRFEDVRFSYSSDGAPQLHDVSLTIEAGTYVAIVGASGSGKSTLLALLLRFFDPDAGRTTIDSVDVTEIDPPDLRAMMGIVFQDTFLFNVTFGENILLADPSASTDQLEAAIAAAGLSELVERLPDGLDTIVGESGRQLSGGQAQRIGLARALLRRPPLLLLDEATSALDPSTEADVVDAIERLRHGRTVVMVTHRLQTAVNADLIVVMRDGTIDEIGRFDQLEQAGGTFAEMWKKQQGFTISRDGRSASVTAERLGGMALFSGLPHAQLENLAGRFAAEQYQQGAIVFEEGEPGDRFYVIVRGVVEVLTGAGDGRQVVAHLEDGDFFGEMALLDDAPRNATVTAVTPTTALSLDCRRFEELLADAPEMERVVRRVAAARARANGRSEQERPANA